MPKELLLLSLFFFITCIATGQSDKRDSLVRLAKVAGEDTAAVNLYLSIGDLYEGTEPRTAKDYYNKAMSLSSKLNYTRGLIKSFTYYSSALYITGNYDSQMVYIQKA